MLIIAKLTDLAIDILLATCFTQHHKKKLQANNESEMSKRST
jgi:hypothetical protein